MKTYHPPFLARLIQFLFGSWIGIILHTVAFSAWFIFKLDISMLTMWVSLEAIYIGILILMAEHQQSEIKEIHEKKQHDQDMRLVKQDAQVNESALEEIKRLESEVNRLQGALKRQQQSIKNITF